MILTALKLKDFQCHEETTISFSPSITTIRGQTDSGKSSILRALRWICQNNMQGEEFVREGQKQAEVYLKFEEDGKKFVLVRIKGSRENLYKLNGKEYKSFLTSVPEDISRILQLNDINFQGQHDSPFWFNETAGEVSRRLNSVIDLTIIDTTLSNIAVEVRQAQARLDVSEERLAEGKAELEKLLPQKRRVEDFQQLQGLDNDLEKAFQKHRELETLVQKGTETRGNCKSLAEKAEEISFLLTFAKGHRATSKDVGLLWSLVTNIEKHKDVSEPPDFGIVETLYGQWKNLEEKADNLDECLAQVRVKNLKASEADRALTQAEETFHKEIKGKACPLCQNLFQ